MVEGKGKQFWVAELTNLFSSGLVSPDKGDVGEIVVALYLLFCGDLLRKGFNKLDEPKHMYKRFSVPLDAWLRLLQNGGQDSSEVDTKDSKVAVGFVQICRNHLRSYDRSWKSLEDQSFLRHLYQSGGAFYTCSNCSLIDMVAPIRVRKDNKGNDTYIPLLMSIKCRDRFNQKQARLELEKMRAKAMGWRWKDDDKVFEKCEEAKPLKKALCLLVVFDSDSKPYVEEIGFGEGIKISVDSDSSMEEPKKIKSRYSEQLIEAPDFVSVEDWIISSQLEGTATPEPTENFEETEKQTDSKNPEEPKKQAGNSETKKENPKKLLLSAEDWKAATHQNTGILGIGIRIAEDKFGLVKALKEMVPTVEIEKDIFASHSFLKTHPLKDETLEPDMALRFVSKSEDSDRLHEDYKTLRAAFHPMESKGESAGKNHT